MGQVLDLDVFVSEPRELKLGGKTFDLTTIPFELSVQVYGIQEAVEKIQTSNKIDSDSYAKIFDLIFKILKESDPELEESWLKKHITAKRFIALMPFIFEALFDDGKKNENPEAAPPQP